MAAVRCDMFKHKADADTFIIANIGVLRGHLDHLGWEHVASGVTPTFAMKSIDERGYHFHRITQRDRERARILYSN